MPGATDGVLRRTPVNHSGADIAHHLHRSPRSEREATGNRRLQRDGRADQVKGDLKQAGEKIKDAMRRRRTPR